MSVGNFLQLVVLAAIWGSSFLFMRIAAPVLGPGLLIEVRVFLAALVLMLVAWVSKRALNLRQHWRHYLIVGILNSALPWFLFAYAAQTLNASMMSVLNSTAPFWAALLGLLLLGESISRRALAGLLVGVCGVATLVGLDVSALPEGAAIPIAGSLLATLCYAYATVYTRKAEPVPAFANAHGSMWGASLVALPLALAAPVPTQISFLVAFSVAMLGVVCTAIALMMYFRLLDDIGPAPTLSVTFMIPVFGILWGNIFLDELITTGTIVGTALVLTGTMLLTGFSPWQFLKR
jgi:drug/metabolite transporter (DMT)-like permease